MNLYRKLAQRGFGVRQVALTKNPKDDRRFISLEEMDLGNLVVQFKSICNVTDGQREEDVKANNALVACVVVEGNEYGVSNLIASEDVIMLHDTSLVGGSDTAAELANNVYGILGEAKLNNLSEITSEQSAQLSKLGFEVLVDVRQL